MALNLTSKSSGTGYRKKRQINQESSYMWKRTFVLQWEPDSNIYLVEEMYIVLTSHVNNMPKDLNITEISITKILR